MKLFNLLLILLISFSFSSCDDDEDPMIVDAPLVGTWVMESYDVDQTVVQSQQGSVITSSTVQVGSMLDYEIVFTEDTYSVVDGSYLVTTTTSTTTNDPDFPAGSVTNIFTFSGINSSGTYTATDSEIMFDGGDVSFNFGNINQTNMGQAGSNPYTLVNGVLTFRTNSSMENAAGGVTVTTESDAVLTFRKQ